MFSVEYRLLGDQHISLSIDLSCAFSFGFLFCWRWSVWWVFFYGFFISKHFFAELSWPASSFLLLVILCLSVPEGPLPPDALPTLMPHTPHLTICFFWRPPFKIGIYGMVFLRPASMTLLAWFMRGPEGANVLKMNPLLKFHHFNHAFSWLFSVSSDISSDNCCLRASYFLESRILKLWSTYL